MIWSHVTGWVMSRPAASATDLRYQRTWVLAHSGATTSWPPHDAPSMAPWRTPSDSACLVGGGDLAEGFGLRELGGEHRIEAHQVDRRVLRRQTTQQLDALLGRARREQLGVDRVLVGAAPLGDAGLAERPGETVRRVGVGVDVPRQRRRAAVVTAASEQQQRRCDRDSRNDPDPVAGDGLVPAPGSTSPQQ